MGPWPITDKIINFKLLFAQTRRVGSRVEESDKSPTRSVGFLLLYFIFFCILYRLK